jgi:hypothetical protein
MLAESAEYGAEMSRAMIKMTKTAPNSEEDCTHALPSRFFFFLRGGFKVDPVLSFFFGCVGNSRSRDHRIHVGELGRHDATPAALLGTHPPLLLHQRRPSSYISVFVFILVGSGHCSRKTSLQRSSSCTMVWPK